MAGLSSTGTAPIVYLVEERANPSTDYFILPAVSAGGHRVVRCGFGNVPAAAALDGAMVVFVRYVPPSWAKLVDAVRPRLRRLVFFMDDDVLDTGASAGMPWRYRFKLARLAAWKRQWLRNQGAELWVATPYLTQKYAEWRPRLVFPSPAVRTNELCRVFYHGSASHAAEIRWLRPIMVEVLRRDERIAFEIIGGQDVYRLFRGMSRVIVAHAMRWPAYQEFMTLPGRHIGLAPLLDHPFNRARSCTKFFDITRCGAVGVYSANGICSDNVAHGVEGLVVNQDPVAWVDAVLRLAHDEPLRQALLGNARAKLLVVAEKAQRSYADLLDKETGETVDE